MGKVKMLVELDYDPSSMHGDDKESKDWFFNDILGKETLILHSNEIGDTIGTIKVLEASPVRSTHTKPIISKG